MCGKNVFNLLTFSVFYLDFFIFPATLYYPCLPEHVKEKAAGTKKCRRIPKDPPAISI